MRHRELRRYLFTGFVLVNLVCWVGLAGVTGLLLTRQVDLGVETLLRQGEATVVAMLKRQPAQSSPSFGVEAAAPIAVAPSVESALAPGASFTPFSPHASPSASPAASLSATAGPTAAGETDRPDSLPQPTSPPTVPSPAQPGATSAPMASQVASGTTPSQPASTPLSPTSLPGEPEVASSPTRALDTLPLLLADPAFGDLSLLNAEMERSAPGRPVQIRYREEALNAEIARIVVNNPALPYRDVEIDLKCGRLVVSGKATVLGLEIDASLEGTLSVHDCRPQFDVQSVSVETLASTGFVKARVADMLEDAMDWYPEDYPLCLEQIVLEESKASIYGHRR